MERVHMLFWGGIALLALVALAGLAIWVPATDGTKQADIGGGIVGGALIGLALLIVERLWTAAADHRQRLAQTAQDMRTSATPDADRRDDYQPDAADEDS